jgi:(1->4)-alpha-D-glucan 1-alpha-D-glucosylmutase
VRGAVTAEVAADANDEYYFYQSLLGAWPAELCDVPRLDAGRVSEFAERLRGALRKAVREAKRRTTWATPDERYEAAVLGLVDAALGSREFLARFVPFANRVARLGVHVSLAQLALKLTAPGVPDIYQGCELWDFSLVDPDNRRRVDFTTRAVLAEVERELAADGRRAFARWRSAWQDGRVKLAVTRVLLALRAREAPLFSDGDYEPCVATGPRAAEILAFLRRKRGRTALTAVQRFAVRAAEDHDWRGTELHLPPDTAGLTDVFTGYCPRGAVLDPAQLFATLPIAVLAPPGSHGED